MKKILAILLAAMMIFALVSCTSVQTKDSEYVKKNGKLVVGITDYAPMDYKDENGNWVGFDADLARAFAESLGVKVEFVEINWDKKILELDSKAIDCVWNGMTLTDEVKAAMSTSNTYLTNTPVIVVPADKDNPIIRFLESAGHLIIDSFIVPLLFKAKATVTGNDKKGVFQAVLHA